MTTWTDEDFSAAVRANISISGVLRALGLSTSPGNYMTFKRAAQRLRIDTSHFKGQAHGTSKSPKTRPIEELLAYGSNIASRALRQRLIKAKLLSETCSECGLPPNWQGKHLTIQLDHINGDPFDNRLTNLRLLCPNCHSQTTTFRRTTGRYKKEPSVSKCQACGTKVFRSSSLCLKCAGERMRKINWPPPEDLAFAVCKTSYVTVAAELGVSDSAIRKYLKRYLGYAPASRRGPRTSSGAPDGDRTHQNTALRVRGLTIEATGA